MRQRRRVRYGHGLSRVQDDSLFWRRWIDAGVRPRHQVRRRPGHHDDDRDLYDDHPQPLRVQVAAPLQRGPRLRRRLRLPAERVGRLRHLRSRRLIRAQRRRRRREQRQCVVPAAADGGRPCAKRPPRFPAPAGLRHRPARATPNVPAAGRARPSERRRRSPSLGRGRPFQGHCGDITRGSVDAGAAQTKLCIGPGGAGEPTRGGIDLSTGGGTTNSGHQGSGGAAPPASPGGSATGGTTGGAKASSGSSGGGCAIAPARAADSALLVIGLAILGLALARRRPRR